MQTEADYKVTTSYNTIFAALGEQDAAVAKKRKLKRTIDDLAQYLDVVLLGSNSDNFADAVAFLDSNVDSANDVADSVSSDWKTVRTMLLSNGFTVEFL